MITRHFVDVGARRVHYRKAGSGPPLLMAHQSPRSSAEYAPLMAQWSRHFTCIAPDTPGFGQSDPLPARDGEMPDIADFADALLAFLDAVGVERCAAYGFHSGGIILASALKRQPARFSGLAIGGYAVWTPAEMESFGAHYLPPFRPGAYGEHLTWAWNRMLEQTWFFPWFAVDGAHRMRVAHDDPVKVDSAIRDLLDSGDAYRAGYGAVLRCPRDLPPEDADVPPVRITAYDGDPLQAHLARLGPLPRGWEAFAVPDPAAHQQASLEFLLAHAEGRSPALAEADDEGFVQVAAAGFDGLLHWKGRRGSPALTLHAPGESVELLEGAALAIDLPGHGLSDDWPGARPQDFTGWQAVAQTAASALGAQSVEIPPAPQGDPARLFPDLSPDRFGAYLTTAWAIVRARHFFRPWYAAAAGNAIAFDAGDIAPERLATPHRALLRARAALDYCIALGSWERT